MGVLADYYNVIGGDIIFKVGEGAMRVVATN